MNDEPTEPNEPTVGKKPLLTMLWLMSAFLPAWVTIACFQIKNAGGWLLVLLLLLGTACSIASSIGLTRGLKSKTVHLFLAIFLSMFFFGANCFIAVFVGCSGIGRVAP